MKWYYLTFRSVTVAQRGEGVLRRKGVDCTLQRAPRWMEERGCGYALRVRQKDMEDSVAMLRGSGVLFSKIYEKEADGTVQEVAHDLFG